MTEKNIFVEKRFLSLNISDFLCKNGNSLWKKVNPLFLSNPPLKTEILTSPRFLQIWWEAQLSPQQKEGGKCTLCPVMVQNYK